ncbi:MAG TPA: hypothetical protein VGY54_18045 [Polyangiaceae bacterium]|nr:hypothetical protein [Polyangiaceae bacterium]
MANAANRFKPATYERLITLENDLTSFADRLGHVTNVYAAAEKITRGKPFLIYHPPMWSMLGASLDMLVVDLCSWAKGMYKPGGFLDSLEPELPALCLPWAESRPRVLLAQEQTDDGEGFVLRHLETTNLKWRRAAYDRLFPGAQNETPAASDLGRLRDRLLAFFKPLRDDRNQHRAHRFEGGPASAAQLSPPDVVAHLHSCQELIADLRCLVSNGSFTTYGYKVEPKPDSEEALDVVDLILCGSLFWIVDYGILAMPEAAGRRYWQNREQYYEALHVAHEARGKPEEPFNSRTLLPMP